MTRPTTRHELFFQPLDPDTSLSEADNVVQAEVPMRSRLPSLMAGSISDLPSYSPPMRFKSHMKLVLGSVCGCRGHGEYSLKAIKGIYWVTEGPSHAVAWTYKPLSRSDIRISWASILPEVLHQWGHRARLALLNVISRKTGQFCYPNRLDARSRWSTFPSEAE